MFRNLFTNSDSRQTKKSGYYTTEKMPHLVQYICDNVPFEKIPQNSIYFFVEDAHDLFKVRITPGIYMIPVIIYRVSKYVFEFYNYEFNLVGKFVFSKEFKRLNTIGKDFEKNNRDYLLFNLNYDYDISITKEIIRSKFGILDVYTVGDLDK